MSKRKKINININPPKLDDDKPFQYGKKRIEELLAKTDEKSTFLPKPIDIKDLDRAIRDYVKEGDLKLVLDGKDVPTFYLSNERWGEFSKTWKFTDDDKNIPTPFLTIKKTQTEIGTRIGNKYNIPNGKLFKYLDVPIVDEGETIFLRYKINQPVNIDLTYEIRLFSKYIIDINKFDQIYIKTFRSLQSYILVKGNYMPVIQQGISEESTVEDIDGDRFYVKVYTIKLLGFLQYEDDFKIVKTIRKPLFVINTNETKKP